MKYRIFALFVGLTALLCLPGGPVGPSVVRAQTTPPKISTQLTLATPKVQRGRTVTASLVIDIPSCYHLNAHNPISKFALPTKIEVEPPGGMKVGSIVYPRAIVRRFSFSDDKLGVYENRAVIRFTMTIPPNQAKGKGEIKARLNYQSCSDEVCFPPETREVTVPITIL